MAVVSDLLGKSQEILGNLEILLCFDEIIKWLLFPICLGNLGKFWEILGNLGKSWEILGNLEIFLYFDEIIKWLLFPIRFGNFGKSWEILNFEKSWEILEIMVARYLGVV